MIKGFIDNSSTKKKRPSITDVAKAAGVSIGAASVVINNKCGSIRVGEDTKRRVQEAVKELGYQPNAMARGLRLKRTGLLGVIVDGINYSIMPEILQGIEDVAKVSDYSLILGTADSKGPDEKYYLKLLNDKKVDGIITVPADGENLSLYHDIFRKGFPCVFVTRRLSDVDIPYIIVDGEALGYQATEHLIQSGHR
jgi:DNA-binding LacI/PurR family transcriptional regulator